MTETTKLTTVEQVTEALQALFEIRRNRGSSSKAAPKLAQRQAEASRIADLYEMRADLWRELGTAVHVTDTIPDAYAKACAVAETKDRDAVKFWRNRAGARW